MRRIVLYEKNLSIVGLPESLKDIIEK